MTSLLQIPDGIRTVPEILPTSGAKVENECNKSTSSSTSLSLPEKSAFRQTISTTPSTTTTTKLESKPSDRLLSKEENKRRNMERFSAGGNLESLTESVTAVPNDPLSSIDPLWPIKKELS
jgi:hypothetical protein